MGNDQKGRDIAEALGEPVVHSTLREVAKRSVDSIKGLQKDIGIPSALAPIGIKAEALEGIVKDAATYRLLTHSPRRLTTEDLRIIVSRALELQ